MTKPIILTLLAACAPMLPAATATRETPATGDYVAVGPIGPKIDLRSKQGVALPADDDPRVKTAHVQLRCTTDHATVNVHWTTFRDGDHAYVLSVWAELMRIIPGNKLTVDSVELDDAHGAVVNYNLWYGTQNAMYTADLHPDGTAKRDVSPCP